MQQHPFRIPVRVAFGNALSPVSSAFDNEREEAPIWKTSSPVCILYMIPYVFPVTSLIISKDRYNVSGCFGISHNFCDFIRYYSNCLDVKAYNWKNCNRLVNAPLGTAKACARLKFTGAPYNRERFVIFDKRKPYVSPRA